MKAFLPSDLPCVAAREREAAVSGLVQTVIRSASAIVGRAAVPPAMTTSTAGLVQHTQAFLSSLVPVSAGAALLERCTVVRWDGAASISFPSITPNEGAWIPEGGAFPVVKYLSADSVVLTPTKIGTITSLTGEMMRNSNAETMIRSAMADSLAVSLDKKLFSADAAVPGTSPPGLRLGATVVAPSGATPKADAMAEDIANLLAAVGVLGKDVVLVAPPAQAAFIGLQSNAFPVLMSYWLPSKTVLAVAPQALVCAFEDAPTIEASKEYVQHAEDTTPGPINGSTPIMSGFQTDSVGLKIRWPVAWALRDARAVATVTNVTW